MLRGNQASGVMQRIIQKKTKKKPKKQTNPNNTQLYFALCLQPARFPKTGSWILTFVLPMLLKPIIFWDPPTLMEGALNCTGRWGFQLAFVTLQRPEGHLELRN